MLKRKPINKLRKTPLAKLKREADALAGRLCRARGKCEVCEATQGLSWAHIVSRRKMNVRWRLDNALCLCFRCHARFTYDPAKWIAWLMENIPTQFLLIERESRNLVKINRQFMEDVLISLKSNL